MSPDKTIAYPRTTSWIWFVAGLGGLALLLFFRNPSVVLRPQFWHEDAIVFLVQERILGISAIFQPYAGYLHLYPRLIAALAACFSIESIPLVYLSGAYAAWLAAGAVILTSPLFRTARWACLAVLVWVMAPHGGEIYVSLTNTPWPMAAALALVMAESPRDRIHPLRFLLVALAAFTGPACLVLSPIAIWRLWKHRRTRAYYVALLTLLAAIVQLAFLLGSSSRPQMTPPPSLLRPVVYFAIELFPELLGTKWHFPSDLPLRLAGTALGVTGVVVAVRSSLSDAGSRRILVAGAGLMALAGVLAYYTEFGGVPRVYEGGQRYLFVPFALYLWALLATCAQAAKPFRLQLVVVLLIFTAAAVNSAQRFTVAPYPVSDWPEACQRLRSGQPAKIKVAPFATEVIIPPNTRNAHP